MPIADLVCFSQLRWNFVFQRPQHLMTRAARSRRVFYIEEPRLTERPVPYLRQLKTAEGVVVCTPYFPRGWQRSPNGDRATSRRLSADQMAARLRRHDTAFHGLVMDLFCEHTVSRPVMWYSTPMLAAPTLEIEAAARVYDCMDELSAFKQASRALIIRERLLMERVDLVFTGGQSLYEAKRGLHPRVYAFPSGVDAEHFADLPTAQEPDDVASLPHPRLGFVGVIDERMDMRLVAALARSRPDWQWIMVGPVAKIRHRRLPQAPNLHYLGKRSYSALPSYLGHFDVAIMPFALNAATRFISPTKTLEYLAAGLPVVSTPIPDVVHTFGERGVVEIADGPDEFIRACERGLDAHGPAHRAEAAALVARLSWDSTWERMDALIAQATALRALKLPGRGSAASAIPVGGEPADEDTVGPTIAGMGGEGGAA